MPKNSLHIDPTNENEQPTEAECLALLGAAIDITGAHSVSVQVNRHKDVMWVNVDGICVLRVHRPRTRIQVHT